MCKVLPARPRTRPPAPHTVSRRATAAAKQAPLPLAEQLRRAETNRAAHLARYPDPPVYTEPNSKQVRQPSCYLPSDVFTAMLLGLLSSRRRRAA